MNKAQRKKLSQEYKKKDLEKYLESGDFVMASHAKIKLGITSKPISETDILNTPNEHLIELLYNKIEEVAERIYKENPHKHKSNNNVLRNFSNPYQLIYYTHQFEMLSNLGDTDKYFENSPKHEIEILAKSYDLIGFKNFSNLIREVANDYQKLELVEKEFSVLKSTIDMVRIEIIRKNAPQFEIK